MSAMPNEAIDWREVFAGQVRAAQACHPRAHAALLNWAAWSRDRSGIFPSLSAPSMWEFYRAGDGEEYGETPDVVPAGPVKPEGPEIPPADEKSALAMDVRLHALDFPAIWRKVVKAAYYWLAIPEYRMPEEAGIRALEDFLMHLDDVLTELEQ